MDRKFIPNPAPSKVENDGSPVKTVISWLIEADREFRVAQSMVNDTHHKPK